MIKFKKIFHLLLFTLIFLKPLEGAESTELLKVNWSFKGLTGKFDRASLQRGFQVYKECYKAGLNIKPTGDALIIAPPFICNEKNIDEIVEKLRVGIQSYIKISK